MVEISIIVRSKNDAPYIRQTLEAIRGQSRGDFELINVDSGSTDGTAEIAREYADIQRVIAPEDYNPGRVLNWASSVAQGSLLVYLNSDATPTSADWLARLVEPLGKSGVGAVFGRQVCRPDAYPIFELDYLQAFPPGVRSEGLVGDASWQSFFSMANSATLREVWQAHPFRESVQYSEDIEWSARLVAAGHIVEYVPAAVAMHSHNYSVRQYFRRCFEEGRADAQIFGTSARRSLPLVTLTLGSAVLRDWRHCVSRSRPLAALRSLPYRGAMKLGRYAGIQRGLARPAELPRPS
jgi:glycosyltransferase involved in cell wall biosynthesis